MATEVYKNKMLAVVHFFLTSSQYVPAANTLHDTVPLIAAQRQKQKNLHRLSEEGGFRCKRYSKDVNLVNIACPSAKPSLSCQKNVQITAWYWVPFLRRGNANLLCYCYRLVDEPPEGDSEVSGKRRYLYQTLQKKVKAINCGNVFERGMCVYVPDSAMLDGSGWVRFLAFALRAGFFFFGRHYSEKACRRQGEELDEAAF